MTFKAFLAPADGEPLPLEVGSNVLGRGNEWGIKSLKVSRKHAKIDVSPETNTITIEPLGVNPTTLAHKGEPNSRLPNNEQVALKHGDIITLGDVSFTVLIVDDGISKMHMDSNDLDATQLDTDAFDDEQVGTGTKRPVETLEKPESAKRARLEEIQIDAKELVYLRQLGTGSCGEVWEGMWRGTSVAIKKIFRSLLHSNTLREFQAESDMLRKLRHPNIVLFMGSCIQDNDMAIVTEFMNKGSLRDVLNTTKLDKSMIIKIAIDAATGMNYLHTYTPPIIHRDLKSMNLLVDSNFRVKVADFGLARFTTTSKAKTFCGTLQWTAPEVLSGIGYTTKADVYSFGVVLWELLSCGELYTGLNQASIISGVTKKGLRPTMPVDCPPAYAKLIFDCWETDPQLRPSFENILTRLRAMDAEGAADPLQRNPIIQPIWEIDSTEMEVSSTIHQGDGSRVFKGKYRGQNVAIKELLKSTVKDVADQIGEFKKDLEIMTTVRNPLVVFFYGATVRPSLSLVMELMEYSLFDVMNRTDLPFAYDWGLVLQLSLESARAVHALHCWKPPIIHCNLKSTKLLVDKSLHVKVAGFGLSLFKSQHQSHVVVKSQPKDSVCYISPEVQRGQGCTIKSDVYSFAIILWELAIRYITGAYRHPYQDLGNLQDDKIRAQAVLQGWRPTLHPKLPPQWASILQRCWDPNPDARPAFSAIIQELEGMLSPLAKSQN